MLITKIQTKSSDVYRKKNDEERQISASNLEIE